jgi:hypothetical protein
MLMHPNTEYVNNILAKNLLGACVESFGLTHQILTITFRDDNAEDHILSIDTEITSNCHDFDKLQLDEIATALLLFNRVNLKGISTISCNDESTLEVSFDNGITLLFNGRPADITSAEPWTIGNSSFESAASYLIIAMNGGGCAVFEGNARQT